MTPLPPALVYFDCVYVHRDGYEIDRTVEAIQASHVVRLVQHPGEGPGVMLVLVDDLPDRFRYVEGDLRSVARQLGFGLRGAPPSPEE